MIDYSTKNDKEIDELYESFKNEETRESLKKKAVEDIDKNFIEIEKEYKKRHCDIKEDDCFVMLHNVSKKNNKLPYTAVSIFKVKEVKDNGDVLCNINTIYFGEYEYRMTQRYNVPLIFPIKREMHLCLPLVRDKIIQALEEDKISEVYEILKPFYEKDVNNRIDEGEVKVCENCHPVGVIFKHISYDGKTIKVLFETITDYDKKKDLYGYFEYYREVGKNVNIASSNSCRYKKYEEFAGGKIINESDKEELINLLDQGDMNKILEHEGYEFDETTNSYKPDDEKEVDIVYQFISNPSLTTQQLERLRHCVQKSIDSTLRIFWSL